jgi:long-chain acyl-CoA synthetase
MLSQKWLVDGVRAWASMDDWNEKGYQYLSFIPPAWATEQGLGIGGSLVADISVNFPEEPETVQENLREIGPQILFYGARLWENVNRMVQAKMIDSSAIRRFLYRACLPLGYRMADIVGAGKTPWFDRILYALAHQAIFRALRQAGPFQRQVRVFRRGCGQPGDHPLLPGPGVQIKLFYGSTELGLFQSRGERRSAPKPPGRRSLGGSQARG